MLSSYELGSVRHIIEHSDYQERDYLKDYAMMEISIIVHQCEDRLMTDEEQRAFYFAVETVTQVDTKHQNGDGYFASKRRNELMQQYLASH